jgi:hypothetical protein
MSLAIEIDKVTQVLLADGWHNVVNDSFEMDAYEYVDVGQGGHLRFGGSGDNATGFAFAERLQDGALKTTPKVTIKGPISSILAIREKE